MLSKSQAKIFFFTGTGVFGAIFLALTVDSMRQIPKLTNEDQMTAQVVAGKRIWEKNNCMGCHTLFGEGAYYAPELTKVYERRGPIWLRVFLKDPEAMFPGERKMVNYHFGEQEIEELIAFFEWCGKVDLNGFPADPPLRGTMGVSSSKKSAPPTEKSDATPHGASDGPAQPAVFQALCTACHAIGGQGGAIGPTLDSVFQRKSRDELIVWLKDPAKVKPGTTMPKLPLTTEQIESLADYLTALGGVK
jgi:nitric oxide reductase subunit C